MAATKKQPKRLTITEAFKLWMGGKGRKELREQTGLSRRELRAGFVKSSGKSWSQLKVESGRAKPKKQRKAA